LERRDGAKLIGSPNTSNSSGRPEDDLDDAPLLDAQHRERERTVARLARRPQVDGERGLQVRGGSEDQVLAGRGVLVVEAAVPDSARRDEKRAWIRTNTATAAKSRRSSAST
jgi:hypothetical protein